MQVSVTTLEGLERKVTVTVPSKEVEVEVNLRLRDVARKAKVSGFRPGKAPIDVIRKRYADNVREEIAREMIQPTLYEALEKQELTIAGSPYIELLSLDADKDFSYSATFEILPQFAIQELEQDKIETIKSEVTDADVDDMITKLREQNKEWHEVKHAAQEGDKLVLDFEGFLGKEPFEGGSAKNFEIVIGSKSMIPGFEDGLIGAEIGKPFDLKVTFPETYAHQELAGKKAVFKITVHKIMEGKMPELDEAFAEKFNITQGGAEALKADIKENMVRELERRVNALNRERIFDKLMEKNAFTLPKSLIDKEIEHLKHEMYHRIFGNQHTDNEQIPDFPRELFEKQAAKRVHLGLLLSEYVKKHELKADEARVNAMIEKFATAYENPDELRNWYKNSPERLVEVEALVMEDIVADKISESGKITSKKMTYDEVMNPKKDAASEGE